MSPIQRLSSNSVWYGMFPLQGKLQLPHEALRLPHPGPASHLCNETAHIKLQPDHLGTSAAWDVD